MLNTVMKFLSGAVSVYTLLIIFRVIGSWLQGPYSRNLSTGPLARLTDPYLNWFRRFPFLMVGTLDFSPVAALIALSVAGNVFNSIAAFGRVSLGLALGLLVSAVWSAVSFFLLLYIILIALRAFGIVAQWNPASPLWRTLDMLLHPVISPIIDRIPGSRRGGTYLRHLLMIGAGLFALRFAGGLLMARLVAMLHKMPF